ncbi:N-acetyl-gamma-glutamyl-phosphate reductase [Laribacter hongkongensis]|uniref:N-acetyl-gamma-glutamyl-phosphate reductase n=4 Tax=Laribacter hongkongensis TaxID=168471 RepID=A0A248LHF2_9NEIS|nr:N-acetyl-gamma-glutamyl-phosphate reductase [Laribacter hongkongensis]ASJ23884.1 N-acetyl-gamma-glutamyl-phosphate reductase [Laribacter hongkongensis]MCG8990919.1 N-acetyl-gamma-glutamyl-phosphate reductase [Laribacter hongkongensis]MCG8997013.1 N-acetyl-gamma-glutamyl-phosphate reductase [Laribacter hongkongensis]MCG9000870.1 N-acetyl-gamma-glutamyl-phosphate reductase [Laribacter hongkongensis]MCG9003504.1 N-acetyl-gamma-glutamyl-phosphate reductase [Laribacter hongkongensis]
MIKVGIVGGTGYTGVELLRLLSRHPDVELTAITSRKEAGLRVDAMYPSLRGWVDLAFTTPDEANLAGCDVVFFATPNGIAMQEAVRLVEAGVRVIDLAADFRIKDIAEWEKWYGMTHASPQLVAEAVYGLPEINRDAVRTARVVANPGCYPTAVQLGFLPLIEAEAIDPASLIADCKSGVSGAGRKAEVHTLFAEATDSFKAYGVAGHRHLPEIRQGLAAIAGQPVGLTFVPHLTPMVRGIHATLYARLKKDVDLQGLFESRYAGERFVDVLPAGSCPETRSVRGSNTCRIAVHRPQGSDTVVVLSVIDNLVKGAAGQAVQNLNLMFGLPESTGLEIVPLMP